MNLYWKKGDMELNKVQGTCKTCKGVLIEFLPHISFNAIKEIEKSFYGHCNICGVELEIEYK
jgi:hypothetical protein